MINLFQKVIDPTHILKMQNLQYSEKILLEGSVNPSSEQLTSVAISSLGHFYCLYITGHFTTVIDSDGPFDDGVSHLRAQLVDASNNRQLFNDYVPLDLFCTPGRVKDPKSGNVLTAPPADGLFYPQVFQYMFTVNSYINLKVKNDSDQINSFALLFHGVRLPMAAEGKRKELQNEINAKLKLRQALNTSRKTLA